MKKRIGTDQWNVEIPEDLKKRCKSDAALLGINMHEWTTLAFRNYLEQSSRADDAAALLADKLLDAGKAAPQTKQIEGRSLRQKH